MKAATSRTGTDPRIHLIGGKGGVGKTTCAAAIAVAAARAGTRVLVASTDPAPSLGDAFNVRLDSRPRVVSRRLPTLQAVEIDAPRTMRRWLADRRGALQTIALEGTWLDDEDVTRLLDLSLPGIDEVAALLQLLAFARSGRFELIVVDTAPTGHTLRMLAMPDALLAVARVFDRMREKHRLMVEALRGGWATDAADSVIEGLAGDAEDIRGLLLDPARTEVSWVTLPEPMAVAETADALEDLRRRGLRASRLIVNRVTPAPQGACGHCDARRRFEAAAMRRLPALPRGFVAARDAEPRGLLALSSIGRELQHASSPPRVPVKVRAWSAVLAGPRLPPGEIASPTTRLVMFGGKGGVGKTTCAAAAAIAIARERSDTTVTLVSTDPAHSLADVLGVTIGDAATRVRGAPPNLRARELDAAAVLRSIRAQYAAAIDALFERLTGGGRFDAAQDRAVLHRLIDLAPPGIDELAAVVEIVDAIHTQAAGVTVIDTAPTGHALRLLEMPALVHDWTKALMSIVLKYQPVTGLGPLSSLLLELARGLRRLRELLADAALTRFVIVTRAAALPRLETGRLAEALKTLHISAPLVVVNAVGRSRCARCARAAALERQELRAMRRTLGTRRGAPRLAVTANRLPPPAAPRALADWLRSGWRYHQGG